MKKSLIISIFALVFSAVAMVKVYLPCGKAAGTTEISKEAIEKILNENPVVIVNAMQQYEQQMRAQMEAEANAMIEKHVNDLNNYEYDVFEGPKNAKIVLVEFFDYACGYCHRLYPAIESIIENNSDVKVVYKPLAFVSQHSEYASRAVVAAKEQGKFKELHGAIFAAQEPLSEEMIDRLAGEVGINVSKLKKDMQSDKVNNAMMFNNELASNIQIGGVPTMVLNGKMLQTLDAAMIQDRINELKK